MKPHDEQWVAGDIEIGAVLRKGIVRFRILSTGNLEDTARDTQMVVDALNQRSTIAAAAAQPSNTEDSNAS
jgi:hypothetical protein